MAPKLRMPDSWVMILGAVIFGGLAVFSASRYITQTVQREKERLNPNVEMADVVVAKGDMKRGDLVDSENMAVRKVPKEFVPGTAVTPDTFGNVEGARLAVEMRRGEVLIRGTLEGADVSTFSTRIDKGVRAITLAVDEVNSISGLLQPNDHVDLFFTAKPARSIKATTQPPDQTRLLLQNVVILATGRQVRPTISNGSQTGIGRAFTTVTIEASPVDAQRLILAQKAGSLTAVLRGNADAQPITAAMMDSRDLFGDGAPKARGHGPSETTEIIIGGKGGGHGERELMQMLGLDHGPAPAGQSAGHALVSAPNGEANGPQMLRDFLKATTPPGEAATMSR